MPAVVSRGVCLCCAIVLVCELFNFFEMGCLLV